MADKTQTAKELRGQPDVDLRAQMDALRRELWQQRQKIKEGSGQQTHQLRAARRKIARIHTLLRERATSSQTKATT